MAITDEQRETLAALRDDSGIVSEVANALTPGWQIMPAGQRAEALTRAAVLWESIVDRVASRTQ